MSDPDTALDNAREALKLAPDLVPAAELAGRALAQRGDLRKATKLLEAAWKTTPHPDIAEVYLHVRPGDSSHDQLARAEKLFALRPDAVESRLTLAKAALVAREFERVHSVLQPLLVGRPTTRACLLMAETEDKQHGDSGHVREWLSRASRAPRDEAWIADGVISDHWEAISPVTGHLDAFRWMRPQESFARPDHWEQLPASKEPGDDLLAPADTPALPASSLTDDAEQPRSTPGASPVPKLSATAEKPAAKKPVRDIPGEVIFPLATSPDDPGPDRALEEDAPPGMRLKLL